MNVANMALPSARCRNLSPYLPAVLPYGSLSFLAYPAATFAVQTLDYDGKIEGVDPDDDGVEHYRLVRMVNWPCIFGCALAPSRSAWFCLFESSWSYCLCLSLPLH